MDANALQKLRDIAGFLSSLKKGDKKLDPANSPIKPPTVPQQRWDNMTPEQRQELRTSYHNIVRQAAAKGQTPKEHIKDLMGQLKAGKINEKELVEHATTSGLTPTEISRHVAESSGKAISDAGHTGDYDAHDEATDSAARLSETLRQNDAEQNLPKEKEKDYAVKVTKLLTLLREYQAITKGGPGSGRYPAGSGDKTEGTATGGSGIDEARIRENDYVNGTAGLDKPNNAPVENAAHPEVKDFQERYAKILSAKSGTADYPVFTPEDIKATVDKMTNAVARNSFSFGSSPALKAVASQLGLKNQKELYDWMKERVPNPKPHESGIRQVTPGVDNRPIGQRKSVDATDVEKGGPGSGRHPEGGFGSGDERRRYEEAQARAGGARRFRDAVNTLHDAVTAAEAAGHGHRERDASGNITGFAHDPKVMYHPAVRAVFQAIESRDKAKKNSEALDIAKDARKALDTLRDEIGKGGPGSGRHPEGKGKESDAAYQERMSHIKNPNNPFYDKPVHETHNASYSIRSRNDLGLTVILTPKGWAGNNPMPLGGPNGYRTHSEAMQAIHEHAQRIDHYNKKETPKGGEK